MAALKGGPGGDIWLFGGGVLFRTLLEAGLVDTVEIAVKPVLLGGGTPLLPPPAGLTHLRLTRHRVYAKTGTLSLEYEVVNSLARKSVHPGGCSAMPAGR